MGKQVPLIETVARYRTVHTLTTGIELYCHPGRGGWGVGDRKNCQVFFSYIFGSVASSLRSEQGCKRFHLQPMHVTGVFSYLTTACV
jgi:hypothetical protein